MRFRPIVGCAVVVGLGLGPWGSLPGASASAGCDGWRVVTGPATGRNSRLESTDAVAADDVWAVGSRQPGSFLETLIEHWNGSRWSIVTSPNGGPDSDTVLDDISVHSSSDAWAVGTTWPTRTSLLQRTFALRWNGSSWGRIPTPNAGAPSSNNFLNGVDAVDSDEAWAVGAFENSAGDPRTLIERWNGTSWSIVPSPSPGTVNDQLLDVDAISAGDAWAVGFSGNSTLIERWNGTRWRIVPSPTVPDGPNDLSSVAVVAPDDAWAVGASAGGGRALIEHWDGTDWTVVPNPAPRIASLSDVSALSADDVWAVGQHLTPRRWSTLVMHWDGTAWSIVPSPDPPGSTLATLAGVTTLPDGRAWAVGEVVSPTHPSTSPLILGRCVGPAPCTILGTFGSDRIRGTAGPDVICARTGHDIANGRAGADIVRGGKGNDRLYAGNGADRLVGQEGNDMLRSTDGVRGNDTLYGGPGRDVCIVDPRDRVIGCEHVTRLR
jgi:Ca2+-binding RTX toxin-like protein